MHSVPIQPVPKRDDLIIAAEKAIAAHRAGKTVCFEVYYYNALEGHAHTARVEADKLPEWLNERPGCLIRRLVRLWS